MNISLLPKTVLGRRSLTVAVAFLVVFILFVVLTEVPTDFNGPPPGFNPVVLLILEIAVIGTSAGTFVTGLIGMIRKRERSVLVFIGVIVTFWLGIVGAVGQLLI